MARLPSIVVALVLLLAGCSGLTGPADERRTVNPNLDTTPTSTATPAPDERYPPGVSADGVDAGRLTDAHADALEGESKTVRVQTTIVATNGTTLLSRTTTTRTDGDTLSASVSAVGASPEFLGPFRDFGYWSDGDQTFVRQEQPNGTVQYRERPGDSMPTFGISPTGRSTVEPLLYYAEFQHVGTERRGNATYHVLTAEPGTFELSEDARNVKLTVAVTQEGLVESTFLRYDTVLRGVEVTYVVRFRASDVGSTTIERPGWIDEATTEGTNASERSTTPTATTTNGTD
ncbi:hypothetical protein HUG10_09750 [Halorarum halophilum]|uniref:Uncharacterized protein n=1 Tax=Halorarum halophilum TaxID=2743090 RepID=A0A7D5KX71_9EURY|nr:hypothetical protein [Halobaculum halophilum]QLG27818.1 hypothetical protein HUG10_09750 [Halobaculum halophilum]